MTALVVPRLTTVWAQAPVNICQQMNSISNWVAAMHSFLPASGRREISASVPRWARSRMATRAPMKVIQTKSQRDSSSDTAMPLLKP